MSLNTGILTDAREAGERTPHREECKLMHGLIEGYIVNNGALTPYRYSYFEKSCRKNMCTRQSRKVTWDMINTPSWHCSCRTYFCRFPLALTNIQLFQKRLSERMANGEGRTEDARPKGTVVTLFDIQNSIHISCVPLAWKWSTHQLWTFVWGFLTPKTKESPVFCFFFFQLKDVPRFPLWTAYCFRLYIASNRKFGNIALNCSFRDAPKKVKPLELNA